MPIQTKIVVKDVTIDVATGRVTYIVQCVSTSGQNTWIGPIRQYSFDREVLQDKFGGDLSVFENWVVKQQKGLVGCDAAFVKQCASRSGATLDTFTLPDLPKEAKP